MQEDWLLHRANRSASDRKGTQLSGSLYSEEHRRKFKVENAEIKVFADSTKPNQLFFMSIDSLLLNGSKSNGIT